MKEKKGLGARIRWDIAAMLTTGVLAILVSSPASASLISCKLTYDLEGWSAFYNTSSGTGHVTCSNGQTMTVEIKTHGGGVSFGTSRIVDGRGRFSGVTAVDDLIGTYAEVNTHAGGGGSVEARAMMKGDVSLSLSGKGQGVNVGFAFGGFTIRRQ